MGQEGPREEIILPDARTEIADKPVTTVETRDDEVARQTEISLRLAQADAAKHFGGLWKNLRS